MKMVLTISFNYKSKYPLPDESRDALISNSFSILASLSGIVPIAPVMMGTFQGSIFL